MMKNKNNMIKKYKEYIKENLDYEEEEEEDEILYDEGNILSFNGKPFWIGIADRSSGDIIDTWIIEKAKEYDFHHHFYMGKYLDDIDNGKYIIFWSNQIGIIECDDVAGFDNDEKNILIEKIKLQLD